MNSVSMSTKNLRALLRKIQEKDLGYRVCAAEDINGPGGGIFIAANTELTPRHLSWIEQRNPARKTTPTYVDVIFVQKSLSTAALPAELDLASEAPEAKNERRRRAVEVSRQVITRGEDVVQEAMEIFQLIGDTPLTVSELRREPVQASLEQLSGHLQHFHGAVAAALDEYLDGNTLIMDLITEYQGPRLVRHGLSVAVFAAEMACARALKGARGREDLADYFGAEEEPREEAAEEPCLQRFREELVEIFVGGFLHDCGLWSEPRLLHEGHEKMGAKLIWSTPRLENFAPSLVPIALFHSDVIRMATREALVEIIEYPDDPEKTGFEHEFYKTLTEARAALKVRRGHFQAEILGPAEVRRILPVALAEYYITHTEGFEAKSRPEAVGNLVRYARDGLYLEYMLALCNAQVEVIAPRRAYLRLDGSISVVVRGEDNSRTLQQLEVKGFEGGSIAHSNDIYSPHLIVLYVRDAAGNRKEAAYVGPQDGNLWGHVVAPESRMYIPAGRHRKSLSIEVTGFMSEEVYEKILGDYERELERQMMA